MRTIPFRLKPAMALWLVAALLPWSVVDAAQESPAVAEPAPYFYEAQGKRDPFQPPPGMVGQQGGESAAVVMGEIRPVRVKEYLERFQLDSLKLVAILFRIQNQASAAMVQDPEGKGHLLRPGDYIGVHEGRVVQITDGSVIIAEPTPERQEKVRTITLRLHKKDEQ
ncbi:MAG: pilus assembly protein PilP [Magnetococcales bacterium]|nr:pilus assembly protein PilP [Magnetococcales bacterium]